MFRTMIVSAVTLGLISGSFIAVSAQDSSSSSSYSKTTVVQSSSNNKEAAGQGSSDKSTSGSSSEVVEQSGVMGFQKSNKFVPKYKERISTYHHQMELGLKNGWLSAADHEIFKKELARLTELEAAVASKGWVKADIDDLDKQFTKFNKDFTDAGQKKPATAAAPAAPAPAAKAAATTAKAPAATTAKTPVVAKKPVTTAKPVAKKK